MKKISIIAATVLALLCLASCGAEHCAECDREVYKDGLCEYHYSLNAAEGIIDSAADELIGSILG